MVWRRRGGVGGRTGWLWSEMNESACSLGEFRDREI